jgi:hypothetical protein
MDVIDRGPGRLRQLLIVEASVTIDAVVALLLRFDGSAESKKTRYHYAESQRRCHI